MDKLNLKQKLVEIRKMVGILQKTEQGNQGARYVDPAVVLLKIREGMDKYNVLLTCEIIDYKNTQVPAPTAKNPNNLDYLSENTMVYTWYDAESNDTLKCPWLSVGSHMQDPSMAFGGGLTFSERYFMLKFFQVPTTKDDPEFLKEKSGVIELVDTEQVANINALIDETNANMAGFCKVMGVNNIDEIYARNYKIAIEKLESKRDLKK